MMPSNPNPPQQDDATFADSQHGQNGPTRGQPPEKPEDRVNVGKVKPEDYPAKDRKDSRPD